MRPLPTLRQLLLLLAFACVVPMAGLAFALVAYEYQRERAKVEADAIGTARALMAAVDDRLRGAERVDPAPLREVLTRQKLPASWITAVLDRSGTIVASTHDHERHVGQRARAALIARIGEVPEDAVESVTVDGVPVVTAFSRSLDTGWSVAIGIPRTELSAPLVRSTGVLLAGTACVLLLIMILAWKMASSLGRSVEALGSAVRAMGHRAALDLPEPVFQEARQLGLAFAHAHAALDDAHAALANSEARMRAVLDTATEAIVTADDAGRIVLFNPAAERLFRLDAEQALGSPLEGLVPQHMRGAHAAMRQQAAEGLTRQMAGGRVIEGVRSDGTPFRAHASISVGDAGSGRLYTIMLREVPTAAQA